MLALQEVSCTTFGNGKEVSPLGHHWAGVTVAMQTLRRGRGAGTPGSWAESTLSHALLDPPATHVAPPPGLERSKLCLSTSNDSR